jgi:hypothetical protein
MVIRVLPTYLVGASSFPSTDSNLIITTDTHRGSKLVEGYRNGTMNNSNVSIASNRNKVVIVDAVNHLPPYWYRI